MTPLLSLSLHSLAIGYSGQVVQSDLSLQAVPGEMIALIGQNGCGKSTLLKTLAGMLPSISGKAMIGDADLLGMSERERAKKMSVVLTERTSADRTTVGDVVAMGRYPYSSFLGGLTEEDKRIIEASLGQTEMQHKKEAYFNELSDGEKQRVLIAKALAQQTPFILLDEPTAHLDLPNRIKTMLLLRELSHTTGRCVLISTHELDLALQIADSIWLMTPRQGVAVGSPAELIASGEFQRAFADPHFRFVSDHGALRVEVV